MHASGVEGIGRWNAVQAGQHRQLVAERLERLEDRRILESAPLGGRRPLFHHHAVRHVDDPKALDRFGGGFGGGDHRRHHAIEKRQRQTSTETTQDGAPGDRLLGDDHDSALRI
jgi:hypothetical protein